MCHMVADSLDELHAMAERIGVKRRWFQSRVSLPHYDICKSKRALAVKYGAKEIDRKELAAFIRSYWVTNKIDIDKNSPPEIPAFIAVCPICGAGVRIEEINEWETETGRVPVCGFHINCVTEPGLHSKKWEEWFNAHWSMPYVDWLPLEIRVHKWFDRRYRIKKEQR
jgi:hypothetical protein